MSINFSFSDEGVTAFAKLLLMQAAQGSIPPGRYPPIPKSVHLSTQNGDVVFTVESKDGNCSITVNPLKTVERFIVEQAAELTQETQHTPADRETLLKLTETFSSLVLERIHEMFFISTLLVQDIPYSLHLLSDGLARQSETPDPLFREARSGRLQKAVERITTRLKLRLGLIEVKTTSTEPWASWNETIRLLDEDEMPQLEESNKRGPKGKIDDYAALRAIIKLGGNPSVNQLAKELEVERATVRLWVKEHGCKDIKDLLERIDIASLPVLGEDADEPPRYILRS